MPVDCPAFREMCKGVLPLEVWHTSERRVAGSVVETIIVLVTLDAPAYP